LHRFLARRFAFVVFSAFAATIIVFTLSRTLGDPLLLYAQEGYGRTPEQMAALQEYLGMDRPLLVQYFMWLGNALKGDLGDSLVDRRPVASLIWERLPATVELAVAGWVVATLIGVPLGVLSAVKRATFWDYLGRTFALFGQATPAFWLGIVAILIFSVILGWLPTSTRPTDVPLTTQIKHFIMPTMVLAWAPAAAYLRLTRSAMLEVLREDYVRTARSKGLAERVVITRHALKNALLPVVTISGLQFGALMGGVVLIEAIFLIPGIGSLLIDSLQRRDFPMVQALIMVAAVIVLGVNLVVDLLYGLLDPRVRYA
jgi:ABC-type dipeptide/oligopeptide/nickel transport system permease component